VPSVTGYQIVDGRTRNLEGCEINIALHCNLRCRSCSHHYCTRST
jgi:hypothetical protein